MTYDELIAKALNGRSVNAAAKAWGVKQQNLDRWVKGVGLPNYSTVIRIARDAGVGVETVVETLAQQEQIKTSQSFKLQMGFAYTGLLATLAAMTMAVTLFLTPTNAKADTYSPAFNSGSEQFILCQMSSWSKCK